MGQQGLKDVDEKTVKLAEALRKRDEQEMQNVLDQMLGSPAVKEEMAGPAYRGVAPSMEISPAVAANPQEAMRLAMMSQSPQIRAMLPTITEQAIPKPITPYQQAQLDLDRQKLTEITPYQKEQLKLDKERLELDRQTKGLGKDLTEAQGKASAFQSQMVSANNVVRNLEANGFNPTSFASQTAVRLAGGAVNPLVPVAAQQYKQAQDQWSEAYLRFKTGAAATEQEVQRNNRTFFPVLGDKPDQIAQKAAAREQAERDIGIAAGRGANLGALPVIPQPKPSAKTSNAPKGIDPKVWNVMTPEEKALFK
jgi:hypothetical protein